MKKILSGAAIVLLGCTQPQESKEINRLADAGEPFRLSQVIGDNWSSVYILRQSHTS